MRTWPALLAAPLLALTDQQVAYTLAAWSCAEQNRVALHAVHLLFLGLTLLSLLPEIRFLRPVAHTVHTGGSQDREVLLSLVALFVGVTSVIVIVAMWATNWIMSPCIA
jgi:hypothetical protein